MVSSKSWTRRSILRSTLDEKYRTSSELSAFILDHFPKIYRTLSDGSDRYSRITALLERDEILDELEQILEISQVQDINRNEINHIKPVVKAQDRSEQRGTTQDTQKVPEGNILPCQKTSKLVCGFFSGSTVRVLIYLSVLAAFAISIYFLYAFTRTTRLRANSSEQCSQCEASCIPELIEEIKDCTALREVILFSENESTALENIDRAISHSACTLDAIKNQLTTGNVYNCSNQQYRTKLFFLMNLISKFPSKAKISSNASKVSTEYAKLCISRHDWQACIKLGESRKTTQERCEDFRKACQYGDSKTKESCIPYFYPDFECKMNGEFTAKDRDELLNDLCDNAASSLACYSLGQISEAKDSCKASQYYLMACMLAKKLPLVCSILLSKGETEFIGKDCEPSGRWACRSIERLADQGTLSKCPDAQNILSRAKVKIDATGETADGTNRASR